MNAYTKQAICLLVLTLSGILFQGCETTPPAQPSMLTPQAIKNNTVGRKGFEMAVPEGFQMMQIKNLDISKAALSGIDSNILFDIQKELNFLTANSSTSVSLSFGYSEAFLLWSTKGTVTLFVPHEFVFPSTMPIFNVLETSTKRAFLNDLAIRAWPNTPLVLDRILLNNSGKQACCVISEFPNGDQKSATHTLGMYALGQVRDAYMFRMYYRANGQEAKEAGVNLAKQHLGGLTY